MVATINDENIAFTAEGDPVRCVEFPVVRPGQAPLGIVSPLGVEHLQTAVVFIGHAGR